MIEVISLSISASSLVVAIAQYRVALKRVAIQK